MKAFLTMAQAWAPVVAIVAGLFGGWVWADSKFERLEDRINAISDPVTGYPVAVRDGVRETLEAAIQEDRIIRAEISADISERMLEQFKETREAIDLAKREILAEIRAGEKR